MKPGQGPQPPGDRHSPASSVVQFYQKHKPIHPRSVRGWFASWRWALVWITQIIFYGLPWLTWNDRAAVLFDLESRRFYVFNLVLYPQDFIYLSALLIISAYALFLFTAVAGRLWCGYACPQTVYSEIFIWIEHHIEGDRLARMKLDEQAWGWRKLSIKGLKHSAWLVFSLWTGLTFVAYFVPIRELIEHCLSIFGGAPVLGPWETFWILFYGFATYFNAGFLREQVCKYMCPYARFQSAMFDSDTLIITYDQKRGDPRGSRPRSMPLDTVRAQGKGDCIDCGLCVQVCPTGIDIRQGLQYECIGCAACIDVCDEVMDKMDYPKGLIRYDTLNGLPQEGHWSAWWKRVFRPRVLGYSGVLVLIVGLFVTALGMRAPLKVDVIRDRGVLARVTEGDMLENVYRLQLMNTTEEVLEVRVRVTGMDGIQLAPDQVQRVQPTELQSVVRSVQVPVEAALKTGSGAKSIQFVVDVLEPGSEQPRFSLTEKSTFIVPRS